METTSTINKILEYLFSNGYWGGIIFLFVFGTLYGFFKLIKTPKIEEAIALWVSSRAYSVSRENLNKHHIFLQQSLIKNKVYSIIFKNDPLKSKVFQVFFATKLEVDIKKIKEFIAVDFKKLEKEELHISMTLLIDDMRITYNNEIKQKLKELCERELSIITGNNYKQLDAKECSDKIYEYVMFSAKGYEEFRNYRIESLLFDLELLRESPIYDDNNERIYHFLDILNSSMNKAILRAGKIFEDFNGEINRIFTNKLKVINKI